MTNKPTMSDALRRLIEDGTAGGPTSDKARRLLEGSLSPERLARDPALQSDPMVSFTGSAGSFSGAIANLRATQRRMTLTLRQDPIRDERKPTAAPIRWRLPFE